MGALLLQEIMEQHFHELESNFKCAAAKQGYTFDYDIFIDTYIKCNESLKHKNVDKEQIINYFWVSFINNTKKDYNKKNKIKLTDLEEASEIIDEPYDDRRIKVYETIIQNVQKKFSSDEFKAWYLHVVENKSYDDLSKMGYNINFHNTFRNINNYIKNKLPKENKEYKNIVKEIFKTK
jgi:cyclopropane fatty-acyl-phospholipid synthase-like methyltransferase